MSKLNRLFIYGTLAPGKVNHHVIADVPGTWQKATLLGVLYEQGWGAEHDCPGIVPDETAAPVDGFVFSSDALSEHWGRLDEFEGIEYQRKRVEVRLEDGKRLDAYVYAIRQ